MANVAQMTDGPGYGETTDGRARHYRITSGSVVVSEDCHYANVLSACQNAERLGNYADFGKTITLALSGKEHRLARFTITPTNHEAPVNVWVM